MLPLKAAVFTDRGGKSRESREIANLLLRASIPESLLEVLAWRRNLRT